MAEGRVDDEMIEIGDPYDESVVVEPPPKVVIEYRERGVPWMLIPPILMICVVGTIVGYQKLSNALQTPVALNQPTTPSRPIDVPSNLDEKRIEPTDPSTSRPGPVVEKVADLPVEAIPVPSAEPSDRSTAPAEPAKPDVDLPPLTEAAPVAAKPAEPSSFPRTSGLGFDPKALEADKKGEIPAADPAIAPAIRQEAAPAAVVVDEKNQPDEMDPELLPPDPRKALIRSRQRVSEAIKQAEADRVRFHNDLREICRVARQDYLKEVKELSERYGMQVDLKIKKRATDSFGPTGRYVGVDRPTRIDRLREIGFPETLILEDIFANYEFKKIGERYGPRDPSDAMRRSILFLLRYAPGQKASKTSTRTTQTPPPPTPAAFSRPNGR